MYRLIFTLTLLTVLVSCNSQDKKSNVTTESDTFEKVGSQFLNNLYNRQYQKCIASMDDIVIKVAKDINLDSAFVVLSNKLHTDYGGQITATLVSSERTFHENLPSTFLIFKVETPSKFGYYFFYINDKSEKILLVSEFSRIKTKRT